MAQHKNEGIYSGEIIAKDQKVKDGRVWGYMWTVAQMGQAVEFNVGEANFNAANIGQEVGIKFTIKQTGFKVYVNVAEVRTLKQAEFKKESA